MRNSSVTIDSARDGVQEKGVFASLIENLRPSHCVLVPSAVTRRSSTPLFIFPPSQRSRLYMHHWIVFVKLREREGQRVDLGRSLKGHL